MDVCRGHKPWPTSQILQTPPMDGCPGSEVWCSRRAFLLGPSSTVGVSSTRQIDAISHGRIRAQYWNVLFLLIDTGNKNMIQIHIWVSWVWMRNMAGTGSKVHIQLTDMREDMVVLGVTQCSQKKGPQWFKVLYLWSQPGQASIPLCHLSASWPHGAGQE